MVWHQCLWTTSSPAISECLRAAETALLHRSRQEQPNLVILEKDVILPSGIVKNIHNNAKEPLTIHTIQVTNPTLNSSRDITPVVMLHGYMNGGAYFYRNFPGLGRACRTIYALDLLGWGLSSRPAVANNKRQTSPVSDAEDWYVETIEAWRKEENLPKMHLVGHSMGGYMAVAYAERYPERIQTLTLLSPVGVPEEDLDEIAEKRKRHNWAFRIVGIIFRSLFSGVSPGDLMRALPRQFAQRKCLEYITRRIPDITDPGERQALADYLYFNNALAASGERLLPMFLTQNAFAKDPLIHRIPKLRIPKCTFLYGAHDWMDITAGVATQEQSRQEEGPTVQIAEVSRAGHLLMLDNPAEVNERLVEATLGTVPSRP